MKQSWALRERNPARDNQVEGTPLARVTPGPSISKEDTAREIARRDKIEEGLICVHAHDPDASRARFGPQSAQDASLHGDGKRPHGHHRATVGQTSRYRQARGGRVKKSCRHTKKCTDCITDGHRWEIQIEIDQTTI
ncbi:MAG TPA: hypothetical protein VFC46_08975 [Humisphaera sp.]|nr:hypothetical protein [Humisphaera sp.]